MEGLRGAPHVLQARATHPTPEELLCTLLHPGLKIQILVRTRLLIIVKSFTNYKTRISISASIDPCLTTIFMVSVKVDRFNQLACLNTVKSWGIQYEHGMQSCYKTSSNYFHSICIQVSCQFYFMFPEEFSESCFSLLVGGQRCSLCSMERRKALKTEFLPGNNSPLCWLILVVTGLSDINPSNFKVSNEFMPLFLQISQ